MTVNFNGFKNPGHFIINATLPEREFMEVDINRLWTDTNNNGMKNKDTAQPILDLFPSENDHLQISASSSKGFRLKESFLDVNGNLMRYREENIPFFQVVRKVLNEIAESPVENSSIDKGFLKTEESIASLPGEIPKEVVNMNIKKDMYDFSQVKSIAKDMSNDILVNIGRIFD